MTDRQCSVEELIELWQNGDLTLEEGDIQHVDHDTIEVEYKGTDGSLVLTYSVSANFTYRTDGEGTTRFNILADSEEVPSAN